MVNCPCSVRRSRGDDSLTHCVSEVSYPDDVYISQEVPSDAATAAQPDAAITSLPSQPQFDRTRKPMATESNVISPTVEQQEWPTKTVGIHSFSSFPVRSLVVSL